MKDAFSKRLEELNKKAAYVRFQWGHLFEVFVAYEISTISALFLSGSDADQFPCWKEIRGQAQALLSNLKHYNFPFLWFITKDGIVRVIFLDSACVYLIASILKLDPNSPMAFLLERLLTDEEALQVFLAAITLRYTHGVIAIGDTPDQPRIVFYAPQEVCHRLVPIVGLKDNHMCLYHIALASEGCVEILEALLKI